MAAGRGFSGCINHPAVEAVARCKQCGKPVCGACVVIGPTGRFCSEDCRERHAEFIKRAQVFDSKRGPGTNLVSLLTRTLVKVILLGLVVLFAAALVTVFTDINIPFLGPILEKYLPQ